MPTRDVIGRVVRRIERVKPSSFFFLVFLVYAGLAVVAYLPGWPGDPSRLPTTCACGDAVQQAWFLEWVPWAILHGHNIFFTTRMYYPRGANLAINTEMPLLGLLTAPLSYVVSPIASFNLLMWAAFPLSAMGMWTAVRRFTHSNLAAAVGGLLYGFSAYIVGQSYGHLNLSFVPLPPLVFLALYEVLVVQSGSARRWGVALGLLCAAQFLISPEILSTTAVLAACGLVILVVWRRRELTWDRFRYVGRAVAPALAIFVVLVGYPAYFQLVGPLRYHGPVQAITNPFRADLLGLVLPTHAYLVAPGQGLADKFAEFYPENGSYIGIPLLLLTLWCLVRYRSNRWVGFAGGLALTAYILSLGPRLVVGAHATAIRLPFDVLGRIPLIDNVLPSRIALYQDLFVALLLSLAVAEELSRRQDVASLERQGVGGPTRARRVVGRLVIVALILAAVVSHVPRWPIPNDPINLGEPSFFSTHLVDQIPYNATVLAYPFPVYPGDWAMLWQETDRLRFTIVGGYALGPGPAPLHVASSLPPELQPLFVQEFLGYEALGPNSYLLHTAPVVDGRLVRDLRTYVVRYHVTTVVLWPFGNAALVSTVFDKAFGRPTKSEGGVELWENAQSLALSHGGP